MAFTDRTSELAKAIGEQIKAALEALRPMPQAPRRERDDRAPSPPPAAPPIAPIPPQALQLQAIHQAENALATRPSAIPLQDDPTAALRQRLAGLRELGGSLDGGVSAPAYQPAPTPGITGSGGRVSAFGVPGLASLTGPGGGTPELTAQIQALRELALRPAVGQPTVDAESRVESRGDDAAALPSLTGRAPERTPAAANPTALSANTVRDGVAAATQAQLDELRTQTRLLQTIADKKWPGWQWSAGGGIS